MRERSDGVHDVEEAAAEWRVRLSDDASPETREGFTAWLAGDPERMAAFERINAVWSGLGTVGTQHRNRRRIGQAVAVLGVVVVCIVATLFWSDPVYQTGRGETEMVALADGSRLTLNTDSRVVVDYARDERRVSLTEGEVFFDVAHNRDRPFIVTVNNETVRVLGTSFLVRRDGDGVQIALVTGSVMVTESGAGGLTAPVTLTPGERILRGGDATAVIDRPRLDTLLAWRRGELILDKTLVSTAVAEMNRYSRVQIVVEDAQADQARITGVFKTGETAAFAQTLARLYGLQIRRDGDRMILGAKSRR